MYGAQSRRKPLRLRPVHYPRDSQQDIPLGRCSRCGQEIFSLGSDLCMDCERMKEYGKSLFDVYPGEGPPKL